jgi:phosphomannomutase
VALIKSISGTRGTIGGKVGDNFTAQDIVESTAAYAHWLLEAGQKPTVVVGRDARISGALVSELVCSTLRMMGISVLDAGLSTTPTVEIAVQQEGAGGGIIITASHNPQEWNALKFLNHKGEFISDNDGKEILRLNDSGEINYAPIDKIGSYNKLIGYIQKHINLILGLELVRHGSIQHRKFKVVVDCINSTGALSMVPLLEQLGCEVIAINDAANGHFAHNPEPLPQNLRELSQEVLKHKADLGVAVDPDVDRLALVCEDGEMFGEEYTLVAVADYVLKHHKGNTVSNLSSTQALQKVTESHGGSYYASAVGEVNVVRKMKEVQAVIGGEGNGGIIYPVLHYGRDAMVGIALFLSSLVEYGKTASRLRQLLPNFVMVKDKIQLLPTINIENLLAQLTAKYKNYPQNTEDGLKIFVDDNWVHLRASNTEPIIRIYAEGGFEVTALSLINKIKTDIKEILAEQRY